MTVYKRATQLSELQDVFNPNPLKNEAEIDRYYQDASEARTGDAYSGFVDKMELLLEDSHDSIIHKLFIGHAGVGKTTELYRLKDAAEKKDFFTCLGRCDVDLDSYDIEYTDVLFYILELMFNKAIESGLSISPSVVTRIENYWNSDIELSKLTSMQKEVEVEAGAGAGAEAGIIHIVNLLAKVHAILKNSNESKKEIRTKIEPKSSELIAQITEVIREIREQLNKRRKPDIPLVILDGLDKIPLAQARKIFQENGSRFQNLEIHLLVTFPISLSYTPEYKDIQIWFPNPEKLPMIKIKNWKDRKYQEGYTEGRDTLIKIIEKRADISLFAPDALDMLITYTGGYLRDLFRCICDAALRARVRKAEKIDASDVQKALDVLESDINGRYGDDLIDIMQKIFNGEKYLSSSEEITTLLQIGAVLEYNGTRWCDLHPLVEKWLLQNNKITRVE